jgi:hypothetical protein
MERNSMEERSRSTKPNRGKIVLAVVAEEVVAAVGMVAAEAAVGMVVAVEAGIDIASIPHFVIPSVGW